MDLRSAQPEETRHVRALLADAALPVDDFDETRIAFIVAVDGVAPVGAIGLETFGDVGLLRSLVVREDARGRGLGGRLVEALEALARQRGLRELVLLTQTAEPFFAHRHYRAIERRAAPASVQDSAEFRSLCPASATCMTKSLEQAPV